MNSGQNMEESEISKDSLIFPKLKKTTKQDSLLYGSKVSKAVKIMEASLIADPREHQKNVRKLMIKAQREQRMKFITEFVSGDG